MADWHSPTAVAAVLHMRYSKMQMTTAAQVSEPKYAQTFHSTDRSEGLFQTLNVDLHMPYPAQSLLGQPSSSVSSSLASAQSRCHTLATITT